MASSGGAAASSEGAKEYTVRVPRATNKKYSILKFNPANNVDFTKCDGVKMERENNLKQYKVANDIDVAPQFGAGSEYGREQREEARRKKFGISKKNYSPEDQPWLLKLGTGKNARKFKGVKEGGITENASYFVFKQSPDGAFEAFPLHEWYNFTPVAKYKSLNAEEAEEAFTQRDKTLNFFSIMVNKRLKQGDDTTENTEDGEEGKSKTKKKSKKDKDFLLTELDEWAVLSDSEDDGSGGEGSDREKKPKTKSKRKVRKLAKQKGSDGEAEEESDDVDEGREVDYMTDTDSEDEEMYTDNVKTDKYEETGVEDADGLRKIIESDEEEEEEKKEDDEQDEEEQEEEEEKQKRDSDSDSSSGSDSDLDKDENITSALFMQRNEKKKKSASKENSRSNTPTVDDSKAQKRKSGDTDSPAPKKSRSASPVPPPAGTSTSGTSPALSAAASQGITEDAVRRYLMRKPMTTKDLLQKFKSKNPNIQKDKLVTSIGAILKKLNPEKSKVKDKLFLHIRKT